MLSIITLVIQTLISLFSSSSAGGTVASVVEGVAGTAAEPFLNPVKMFLRIGAILAVVAAIGGAYWYVTHLQSELALAQANNVALTAANSQQKQALQVCSDNTVGLQKAADAWAARATELQAQADKAAQPYFDKAKKILNIKPVPGQSDIDAINDLLNSLIPARAQP